MVLILIEYIYIVSSKKFMFFDSVYIQRYPTKSYRDTASYLIGFRVFGKYNTGKI